MDAVRKQDLLRLLDRQQDPCVSLYLPVHRDGTRIPEDRLRMKNLLAAANREIQDRGFPATQAREILAPLEAALADESFWQSGAAGIVVLCMPGGSTILRLGTTMPEAVRVADSFYMTPLAAALHSQPHYFVLAVSRNHVQLYRADAEHIAPVAASFPRRADEAIGPERKDDLTRHFHSAGQVGRSNAQLVFHGQADMHRHVKDELAGYFQEIAAVLQSLLHGETAPLIFAGVAAEFPLFRQHCSYPHLFERPLAGNYDYTEPHELHAQAQAMLRPVEDQERREIVRQAQLTAAQDENASRVEPVLRAIRAGRVATLLVDPRRTLWGRSDETTGQIVEHATRQRDSVDLINRLVCEALRHNAQVRHVAAEELPSGAPLAVVYRYAAAKPAAAITVGQG